MVRPIAIIPARGGSKRLPRKNILPLDGKPLLAHVICTALKSEVFEKIIVSSEDEEILSIAKDCGVEAYTRPVELSTDQATVDQVCTDILEGYNCTGYDEFFCILYSTSALLNEESIKKSFGKFTKDINYVMGVSRYNYPPVQALKSVGEGCLEYQWPEYKRVRSQSYPELVVSNGSFYWARCSAFLQDGTIYGPKLVGYEVPNEQVCDVDVHEDYEDLKRKYFEIKSRQFT